MNIKNNKVIITNFLNKESFTILKNLFLGRANYSIPWMYVDSVAGPKKSDFQFVHGIWEASVGGIVSREAWNSILPIIGYLNPLVLIKVKSNLRPRTEKLDESDYHTDITVPGSLTAIFYINTCDGYTKFIDGDKIKSVENKLVIFPSYMNHLGTTCTDEKLRVVINFNFIPKHDSELALALYTDADKDYAKQWDRVNIITHS